MLAFSRKRFIDALRADIVDAWDAFQGVSDGSPLVQFGVSVTSDVRIDGIIAIGKTEAHLEEEVEQIQKGDSALSREACLYDLRISCYVEPAMCQQCDRAEAILNSRWQDQGDRRQDRIDRHIHEAYREVLSGLDHAGHFGVGEVRHRLALGGFGMDVTPAFVLQNVRMLNPPPVLEWFERRDPRSDVFYRTLDSMLFKERADLLLPLWTSAVLEDGDPRITALAAGGIDQYSIAAEVTRLGARVVPGVIRIMDEASLHPPLNLDPSGRCWSAYAELAIAAAFLLAEINAATDMDIERMLAILRRSVARDAALAYTTTFSANLARVLHILRPTRFPDSVLNGKSCHLMNYEDFI